MFYWLYEQLSAGGHIPVFNLFKYLTFRTGMSLFTAQIVVVAQANAAPSPPRAAIMDGHPNGALP